MVISRPLLARGHQAVKHFIFHSLSIGVFIVSFYILLSLLSHTFLLSHIAIDPQSESPISQRLLTPLPPRAPKAPPDADGPSGALFFGPQDPPIRMVKPTLSGLHPQSAW
jgi:hypothetical protein